MSDLLEWFWAKLGRMACEWNEWHTPCRANKGLWLTNRKMNKIKKVPRGRRPPPPFLHHLISPANMKKVKIVPWKLDNFGSLLIFKFWEKEKWVMSQFLFLEEIITSNFVFYFARTSKLCTSHKWCCFVVCCVFKCKIFIKLWFCWSHRVVWNIGKFSKRCFFQLKM